MYYRLVLDERQRTSLERFILTSTGFRWTIRSQKANEVVSSSDSNDSVVRMWVYVLFPIYDRFQ